MKMSPYNGGNVYQQMNALNGTSSGYQEVIYREQKN